MRKITFLACMLVCVAAVAQYIGPGFYRVHNAGSDCYISIKGTHYQRSTEPDAFWSCVQMNKLADVITEPGSIIYIPDTIQTALYGQGVDTYSLTGLPLDVWPAPVMENDRPTYVAHIVYDGFNFYFRDYGNGMTSGGSKRRAESHWWIEPVNEASIDTSYMGLKPVTSQVEDSVMWYWATMCCDFPIWIPVDGGVEGAYTVRDLKLGSDSLYYAEPVKVYGQGDTVPAATPILFKCASPEASGNKVVPVGAIANHTTMPIASDMLMGNYFSNFKNHGDLNDYSFMVEYIPSQSTKACSSFLALGFDENGNPGFYPQTDGTYMAANSAWLSLNTASQSSVTAVYLGKAPVDEPLDPEDPEDPEESFLMGDVNDDGKLTIGDATQLINFLINDSSDNPEEPDPQKNGDNADEDHPVTEISFGAADINGDGIVNVTDLSRLIAMLLETQD